MQLLNMHKALQTSGLVDEVTCIVDAKHSLLPCIFFMYLQDNVLKNIFIPLTYY
jgi:hypothetical protein